MSRLVAQHLAKSYGRRTIVRDLSLEVGAGEVVGLLGPNGAGKTTAFYMIVGLVPADAGRILIDDTDLTHRPIHARAQAGIGYLPQEASVFRKLSVEDNVLAILETRPGLDGAARRARCDAILADLRIDHVRTSPGMALSGGERRRVEIARALAADPRFLLLDEPFAGVDPISVLDIQRIVRELAARGIGVLITDHNVRETLGVCQRSYIIGEGTVMAAGSAEEILANPRVREVYLGESFRL
ncbi:MAG: LPS export ABC transporter ATP-binding protein [Gammaproteobacteria bacterium]|jgi:lipopolysaccharide export system ATP-binding protein